MTLDQLITFYRKVQEKQPDGSLQTTMQEVGQAFAAVRAMRGAERNAGDQTEAQSDYIFSIAYRSDLIADDVIQWNGSQFNIRFISDNGSGHVYMTIEAQRGVAI